MAPGNSPRIRDVACRLVVGILTVTAGISTLVSTAAASEWQSPDSIRAAARELALRAFAGSGGVQIDAIGVDERLRLPACAEPLGANVAQAFTQGRGTVAVTCSSPRSWRLFVPVRTSRNVQVVVLRRGVQRGEVLAAADLALQPRPSAALPYDYLLDVDDAIGLTVKRSVPAGSVLVPAAIERPRLIERGALVTLVSAAGPVLVKSQGVAIEPGSAAERIRVRTASGRIVAGTVAADGEVHVGSRGGS